MLTISYTLLVAICLIALMTVMTVFGILSISNKIKNKKKRVLYMAISIIAFLIILGINKYVSTFVVKNHKKQPVAIHKIIRR